MSLMSSRDSRYLKLVRDYGKRISQQRNYDFIMIWIIYFVAENYLNKKYSTKLEQIFMELKNEVQEIGNDSIKTEALNLLDYVAKNRLKLVQKRPITNTFNAKQSYFVDYD